MIGSISSCQRQRKSADYYKQLGNGLPPPRSAHYPHRFYPSLVHSHIYSALPEDAREAFSLLVETVGLKGKNHFAHRTVTAFQGVRVDDGDLLNLNSKDYLTAGLLLNGPQAPEVDLGRAGISALPPALCAELLLLQSRMNKAYIIYRLEKIAAEGRFNLLPRRELRALLEQHPVWRDALMSGSYDLSRIQEALARSDAVEIKALGRRDLLDALRAAALTEFASISRKFTRRSSTWLTPHKARLELEDFPPLLFAEPLDRTDNPLLNIMPYNGPRSLNVEHRFSQWLIRNGAALRERVPELYGELLDNLTRLNNKDKMIETVNRTLRLLSGYPGNAFSVTEDLYLTDEDIDIIEEEISEEDNPDEDITEKECW